MGLLVVVTVDRLKRRWVLAGGAKMPEGVAAVGLETLRERKCVMRGWDARCGVRSVPETNSW